MFKDLAMAFKLASFGAKFKSQLIMAAIFGAIGIVVEIVSRGTYFLGGFYVTLAGVFIFQMIYSMDLSTLIQSSTFKRKIQLRYPYIATGTLLLSVFTVLVLLHAFFLNHGPASMSAEENAEAQARIIFVVGILLGFMLIYMGFAYKYFAVGTIVMILVVAPVAALSQIPSISFVAKLGESFSRAVIVSYIIIICSLVISYLLARLFYKKNISEYAFKNMLK